MAGCIGSQSPGTILVGFEVMLPANSENALEVTLVPQGSKAVATKKLPALKSWK